MGDESTKEIGDEEFPLEDEPSFLVQVVRHELIHYALQTECTAETHGPDFQALAELVGLAPENRD